MKTLPDNARFHKQTVTFDINNVPAALLAEHKTKPGVWGKICVLSGRLKYTTIDQDGKEERVLKPDNPGVIAPEQRHFVKLFQGASFYIEFFVESN